MNLDFTGEVTVQGRLLAASNATFLVTITQPTGEPVEAVYKPVAGEKPLWDFPDRTLGQREVAAAIMSEQAGFGVVPETAWIDDGPLGPGMVQRWIEAGNREVVDVVPSAELPRPGWFEIFEGRDEAERAVWVIHANDPLLRTMALFDVVVNNSDRKGGHIICTDDAAGADEVGGEQAGNGHGVWGVDHGVAFHPAPKLRTILWGWANAELASSEYDLLVRAAATVDSLEQWLTKAELGALAERIAALQHVGRFPAPQGDWPPMPWPVW